MIGSLLTRKTAKKMIADVYGLVLAGDANTMMAKQAGDIMPQQAGDVMAKQAGDVMAIRAETAG